MSRRICIDLYRELVRLRPDWHSDDDDQGAVKVVMTGSATDPLDWQPHIRNKPRREALANRFRRPHDPFRVVLVRDMWLTGFDAPSLHTMYVDKPMRGHGLTQAIARVNRVFKDKPGGLVVDYLGFAQDLKLALATYTESGGTGQTAVDQEEAVAEFRDAAGVGGDGGAEAGGGDDGAEDEAEPLEQRVAALEEEGRGLREMIEAQTGQLEELGRRASNGAMSSRRQWRAFKGFGVRPGGVMGCPTPGWSRLKSSPTRNTPSVRRRRWLQSGGRCGPMEKRWGSRVDRARTGVRRWELEIAILRDFHLTLPPETEPLDEARRADHPRQHSHCAGGVHFSHVWSSMRSQSIRVGVSQCFIATRRHARCLSPVSLWSAIVSLAGCGKRARRTDVVGRASSSPTISVIS